MESKTKIPFRYIAGGCFAACALIYSIIRYGHIPFAAFYPYDLLCILAFATIAVGLFLSAPMVSAAGSALLLVRQVICLFYKFRSFLNQIKRISSVLRLLSFLMIDLIPIIFALLLLITCLDRRSTKPMGMITAAVRFFIPAVYFIIIIIRDSLFINSSSQLSIALLLLESVGALCLGFAFSELKDKPKAAAAAAPKTFGVSDTYEKLTHLKELLDKGIITQGDFDAKKKDILGS